MKVKEVSISIKPSKDIKGYKTVDVLIRMDSVISEANELLRDEDIESRLDEMLNLAKTSLLEKIKSYEND